MQYCLWVYLRGCLSAGAASHISRVTKLPAGCAGVQHAHSWWHTAASYATRLSQLRNISEPEDASKNVQKPVLRDSPYPWCFTNKARMSAWCISSAWFMVSGSIASHSPVLQACESRRHCRTFAMLAHSKKAKNAGSAS